ncbi:MAG: AsmA family protein [Planctomycetaceae bacterium]|nr:AsmA family protein [Planctomycetaceae bacterium]
MDTDAPKSRLTAAPTRKPRGFKIALIILAALFVLFVATIYFLPSFLPIGTIKNIAKTQAADLAGLDVDFENLRFGWNGDVVLDNITVSPLTEEGLPGDQLLHIREVRTNIALTPLLSGKAIINSVDVNGFTLTLRRAEDGSLNLPDFEGLAAKAGSVAAAPVRTNTLLSSAVAAETAATQLPPIELHRLDLRNGVIGFEDVAENMNVDMGLDFLRVEGATLDDPFILSGRLLPYVGNPAMGDIPFTGRIAMVRNGAFNPDGEASFEINMKSFDLQEMAANFGLSELLPSARLEGLLRAGYADRKAVVQVPEMRLTQAILGLGGDMMIALPDTVTALSAEFDPEPGFLAITDLSLTNDLAALRARGQVDGINELGTGALPAVGLDFSGTMDFSYASHYLASQPLGLGQLPELDGDASFVGKAVMPAALAGTPPSPSLSIDFNEGSLGVIEAATGIIANLNLQGVGVRATAVAGDDLELNSQITLANVPARAFIPQVGEDAITVTVNGGAALQLSPETTAVELRLNDTRAAVPATPWSSAMAVGGIESRITYDLDQDLLHIASAQATINDVIEGRVVSGSVGGILSGDPQGQVDLQLSALLQNIKEIILPLFPSDLVPQLAGSLRGVTRLKLENGAAEAFVQGEVDNSNVILNVAPGVGQAEVDSPKANLALLASINLENPTTIVINSLEANGTGAVLRYSDRNGNAVVGNFGPALMKTAGTVDADNLTGTFSAVTVDLNGMAVALGKDGQQVASIASGLMKTVLAGSAEQPLLLPFQGTGDFAVPSLDFGVDNLVFQFNEQPSNFGNVRAKVGVDGYIGPDKRQLINLRTATLAAAPIAVNSRGQFDLGSNALVAQYAARVAPSGLASLFGYLGLPPALLTDAAVSGTLTYSDAMVEAKGTAQGQLSAGENETYPFQAAHDLSAAWDQTARTLALDVRRLEGGVTTASGEAVATMQAQQSRLLLSRAGSKGLLDVRFNGSAAPTRHLLLGLSMMVPQLYDLSTTLYTTQADGVYNAWLQVRDKDEATLGLNLGGVWQGAALALDGQPFLAEAAQLSAAVEGELAYRDNQLRLSRLLLRSDSGMVQADGALTAAYTPDENGLPTGVENLDLNLRFVMADMAKAALAFPGVIPAGTTLAGRMEGVFQAGGSAQDIRISEGAVRFQNFSAATPEGLELAIPQGGATFGANINLRLDRATGSPFDAFHMMNITGGAAAVSGVQLRGQTIQDLSAAFSLENGVLTLQHARLNAADSIGAQGEMAGTVDFNSPDPSVPGIGQVAVNARFSVADLARTAAMLPGLVPDMGLAGRVDGVFQAGGSGNSVRVNEGSVNFQGFKATVSEGMDVTIQNGSATFGAIMDLHFRGRATGSDWDMLRMFNLYEGRAAVTGMTVMDKVISDLSSTFVLENGVFTIQRASVNIGGGAGGTVALNGVVDFNNDEPAVNTQLAMQSIPLAELNSELADFMTFESGVLNVPATQGQAAGVAFTGFSEDAILRTLRLSNFTFATGPVKLLTGPVLNTELDKARALMRQQITENKAREITFTNITGSAVADGTGVISIPQSAPINLIGDNTADFRAHGVVNANHTLDVRVMVAGKLENLIGFTLPNLIPNLRTSGQEEQNKFMAKMNENAAKGNYGLNVRGSLDSPDISGIGEIAAAFLRDIVVAVPGQIIGGVLNLGKDAPGALKGVGEAVVGELLNPGEALKNAPGNIVRTPENVVKGLGQMFGITRNRDGQDAGTTEEAAPQQEEEQQQRRSLRLPFGIH